MDIKRRYSDTDSLDVLLVYQARRDAAIGLARPGARTLSLLDYKYQREREATKSLAGAAFLKALIDECRSQVKGLIQAADTPEARREALVEAERLNTLAEKAAVKLEEMSYAG